MIYFVEYSFIKNGVEFIPTLYNKTWYITRSSSAAKWRFQDASTLKEIGEVFNLPGEELTMLFLAYESHV